MAQTVKSLPAVQETWVRFLGWEDRLEKEMATHSSILAWKIPWMEEPGRLQSMQSQRRIMAMYKCEFRIGTPSRDATNFVKVIFFSMLATNVTKKKTTMGKK